MAQLERIFVPSQRRFVREARREIIEQREELPDWKITADALLFHDQRALSEGLCSHCKFVKVHNEGESRVGCELGNNPREIYMATPTGEHAECKDFNISEKEVTKNDTRAKFPHKVVK